MPLEKNELETAIETGKKLNSVQNINGVPVLINYESMDFNVLDEIEPALLHTTANKQFETAQSFINYVTFYLLDNTALFISDKNSSFHAIMDYHSAKESDHCLHTADYSCPKSDEWLQWIHKNKVKMSQYEFALHIEDNIDDISSTKEGEPTGADMLTCALSLTANKNVDFSSKINISNGLIQFGYSETLQGAEQQGKLTVPENFYIGIPVFKNEDSYKIKIRLRYKIQESNLQLWYEMVKPSRIIDDAFNKTKENITSKIDCPAYT